MESYNMKKLVGASHSFSISDAKEYGVNKAVILHHINFWSKNAEIKKRNFYEHSNGNSYYFTANSLNAFNERFPYMNIKNISRWLLELEEQKIIISSKKFNKFKTDGTKWYSCVDRVNNSLNTEHHKFSIHHAKIFGIKKAILLYNICYWLEHNRENKVNIRKHTDGKEYYWTYNTVRNFNKFHPYFNRISIRRWLKELEMEGALKVNNFNSIEYYQQKWFTAQGWEIKK